jgi:hypothetical protein
VQEKMRERGMLFDLADFGTTFNSGPAGFRRLIRMGVRHPALARFSSLGLWLSPHYRRRLDQIVQQNRALIEVITGLQSARVFLDGSKDPERLTEFVSSGYWHVKVIHLVRDGRGVANSLMKHGNIPMQLAASEWLERGLTCDRVLSRFKSSDVLSIKYENLCEDPESVMERVLKFAGLGSVRPTQRKSVGDLHILGNDRTRLNLSRAVVKDEAWKRELGVAEIRTFDKIAGPRNRYLGYCNGSTATEMVEA